MATEKNTKDDSTFLPSFGNPKAGQQTMTPDLSQLSDVKNAQLKKQDKRKLKIKLLFLISSLILLAGVFGGVWWWISSRSPSSSYSSSCSFTKDCLQGLTCIESKCLCPLDDERSNSTSHPCLSKVHGICSMDSDCVENADCDDWTRQCTCRQGYLEDSGGHCKGSIWTICQSSKDCLADIGLICMDGSCNCKGFSRFKEDRCRDILQDLNL